MRSTMGFAILALLLLPVAAVSQEAPALSAPASYVPPSEELLASIQGPARLAVYFDRIAHSRTLTVEPGQLFEFHLMAVGAVGGLRAWEAQLLLDERIEVISRNMEGMNLGRGVEAYQVGLGNRCLANQEILLVSYTARVMDDAASDLFIGIGPAPRGSLDPPAPCYLACDPEIPLLALEWPELAAVINPDLVVLPPEGTDPDAPHFEMESVRGDQQ